MFHRRAKIPANRASTANRASPPHVIGPLNYRIKTRAHLWLVTWIKEKQCVCFPETEHCGSRVKANSHLWGSNSHLFMLVEGKWNWQETNIFSDRQNETCSASPVEHPILRYRATECNDTFFYFPSFGATCLVYRDVSTKPTTWQSATALDKTTVIALPTTRAFHLKVTIRVRVGSMQAAPLVSVTGKVLAPTV